jgi:hypothetical protein
MQIAVAEIAAAGSGQGGQMAALIDGKVEQVSGGHAWVSGADSACEEEVG